MKKFLFLFLFLFSGCISIVYHAGNEVDGPYTGTREVWKCVNVWSRAPGSGEEAIAMTYVKLTYGFWLVDFPFELVTDTVLLPLDAYNYYK